MLEVEEEESPSVLVFGLHADGFSASPGGSVFAIGFDDDLVAAETD